MPACKQLSGSRRLVADESVVLGQTKNLPQKGVREGMKFWRGVRAHSRRMFPVVGTGRSGASERLFTGRRNDNILHWASSVRKVNGTTCAATWRSHDVVLAVGGML